MRIKICRRRNSFTVWIDRPPMTERRFYALCGLAAAGVYASMVTAVAALCGLFGLITVGVVTVLLVVLNTAV